MRPSPAERAGPRETRDPRGQQRRRSGADEAGRRSARQDDRADAAPAGNAPTGGGSLEEILRDVLGGGRRRAGRPQSGAAGCRTSCATFWAAGRAAAGANGGSAKAAGRRRRRLLDMLRQVLGQATSGVREGAGRIDDATGASGRARDAIGQTTGRSPEELIAQLKELIASNKLGAGAALGGLGALILGTGAGRSLAASAVKLGGLALIGGLAYKAYQNYQQGQPPSAGAGPAARQALLAAPEGSGFEAAR